MRRRRRRRSGGPLPFREYPGVEYYDFDLPTDFRDPAEWVFARLMYPSIGWGGAWQDGGTSWTIDYPKGDRHIAALVRRLSVINARSVEQPVNLDDGDDVFNWPWLYAVEVGQWDLTDSQAAQLREYLLRGGFLMVDDFHGSREWTIFVESMRRVFPDRPIVDLPDDDPIFHTFWDLEERQQIPGLQFVFSGRPFEQDGFDAHWRGIYDDEGRVRGGHLPQHGFGRRRRALRYARVSAGALGHRDAHLLELHRLRDDALAPCGMSIEFHRRMLADRVRHEAFRAALKHAIEPGTSTVADIGAGTGVLAFFARELGAREVWLYDPGPALSLAEAVAARNGIEGLNFVPERSLDVADPPRVDIVVAEVLGNFAYEEDVLETLRDAQRYLRPGGTLIPASITQWVAPVTADRFERDLRTWRNVGFGLDWSDAERMTRNNMYVFAIEPKDLLGEAARSWDSLDFRGPIASRRAGRAAWQPLEARQIFGFALWWDCTLAPGVVLSTSPHAPRTHWDQIYLPLLEPHFSRARRRDRARRSRARQAVAKAASRSVGRSATSAAARCWGPGAFDRGRLARLAPPRCLGPTAAAAELQAIWSGQNGINDNSRGKTTLRC